MNGNDALAKIVYIRPNAEPQEFVLSEGATTSIGRSSNNDIQIPEQHVSRQHAVIRYRDGMFMISDLGSSNGTFVNEMRVEEQMPLIAGDEIRLYVPVLKFMALRDGDAAEAEKTGTLITAPQPGGQGSLTVTNGPQEGQTIPLLLKSVTIGRATRDANWQVMLQDPSVSRPHARVELSSDSWTLYDLGSSNGTTVNGTPVTPDLGYKLNDGDTIALGGSIMLFRIGWQARGTGQLAIG